MKKYILILILLPFLACNEPEARKPIKVKTGSFFKESVERNKQLLAQEETTIKNIIAQDTVHQYEHSASGSWYYYLSKNEESSMVPETDDLVSFNYSLLSLENDTIYSPSEIGTITYKVDKQELFPGLRNSVKLLKEGETAVFLFPSSLGYGYHGDDNKIGTNVPLKAVISLHTIEKTKDSIQS